MTEAVQSIQLAVTDLGATEAFYAGILGLPVERALTSPAAPDHLTLSLTGYQIIFVQDDALALAHPLLGARLASFPRGVGMTLHCRVDDIEGIYQALVDEDLEVLYPLDLKPYGAWELWCFDPDGYLVVLEQPAGR